MGLLVYLLLLIIMLPMKNTASKHLGAFLLRQVTMTKSLTKRILCQWFVPLGAYV